MWILFFCYLHISSEKHILYKMVASAPFSAVLHQLLSTAKPTSSKGKGKARSQPSDFLTRSIESKNDWNESVKAFCSLVEKYNKDNNATKGI